MVMKRYTIRYGYEEIHNEIWLWRDTTVNPITTLCHDCVPQVSFDVFKLLYIESREDNIFTKNYVYKRVSKLHSQMPPAFPAHWGFLYIIMSN